MAKKSSPPDEPDLAILLVAANRVLVDRLMAAMDRAGLTMRSSWGYVIRALHAEPLPLARLAERLDVTKQAAQQMVDDMVAAGLVERRADPGDGRRKLLALTADGRRVRATALGVSAALEAEVGERHAPVLRAALLGLVERHGDADAVRAGRARALIP
jgi:DNA-binding MarR family transcriptional regulator